MSCKFNLLNKGYVLVVLQTQNGLELSKIVELTL